MNERGLLYIEKLKNPIHKVYPTKLTILYP